MRAFLLFACGMAFGAVFITACVLCVWLLMHPANC